MDKIAKCEYPECPGAVYARGICRAHYGQRERGQELHPTKAMLAALPCAFGDGACPEPVFTMSRQLCRLHYWQWQRGNLVGPTARTCVNCGEEFVPQRNYGTRCCSNSCSTVTAALNAKYGITGQDIAAMLAAQGHKCLICGSPIIRGGRKDNGRLHVDHCHTTGRVRGLLCGWCNRGLGHFRDDPDLLLAAAKYLKS